MGKGDNRGLKFFVFLLIITIAVSSYLVYFKIYNYQIQTHKAEPPTFNYQGEELYRLDQYIKIVYRDDKDDGNRYRIFINLKDLDEVSTFDNNSISQLIFKVKSGKTYKVNFDKANEAQLYKYLIKRDLCSGVSVVDLPEFKVRQDLDGIKERINEGDVSLSDTKSDTGEFLMSMDEKYCKDYFEYDENKKDLKEEKANETEEET